jgi:transposase
MCNPLWLTDEQMERLKPFFPPSHGKPPVDDRRVMPFPTPRVVS